MLSCGQKKITLQWRHNERDGVSNHLPHDCLLNRLCRRTSTVNSPHKGPVTQKMFPFDDVNITHNYWSQMKLWKECLGGFGIIKSQQRLYKRNDIEVLMLLFLCVYMSRGGVYVCVFDDAYLFIKEIWQDNFFPWPTNIKLILSYIFTKRHKKFWW